MRGILWILQAVLTGSLLAMRFARLSDIQPAWAGWSLIVGLGAAAGIGLSSCLFFLVGVLFGALAAAMSLELVILAAAGYLALNKPWQAKPPAPPALGATRPWLPSLMAILLLVGILGTLGMTTAWRANPQGYWDGWAIWNLRARMLASGPGLAPRAWSPVLGAVTHSEYPLLLSAFVARCWVYSGSTTAAVPAATSYVFFLALLALVAGGIAALRGSTLGLLAALALAGAPPLLDQVPAQYSDVPLACYLAGATIFALLDRRIVAGLLAGLAAWTKDEGVLFLVLLVIAAALFQRRSVPRVLAGALPAVIFAALFKMSLAHGNPSWLTSSLPGAAARLQDPSRYRTILSAYGREFVDLITAGYHPIYPLVILALCFRFDARRWRDAAFCGTLFFAMLLGYFAVYAITVNDLRWHLATSLDRLLVQVWPLLVLAGFGAFREPESRRGVPTP
jgi:hypothetical protein